MAIIGKVDPVGRMEGHMGLDYHSDAVLDTTPGTKFTDVEVEGTMYRGFENIMLDRQPQEGIQICQRI